MYDPYSNSPAAFDAPDATGERRSPWLLWGCLAGLGGALMLVAACALVALFFVPVWQEQGISLSLPSISSSVSGPPPEAPRKDQSRLPSGLVMIEENFDQPTNRWDQSAAQVADGSYELRIDIPNNESYGLFLGGSDVSNFDMAVDVQQVAGDPTAEYGIRFRQSGPGDYLMFSLSGSGYYRLVRVVDEEYGSVVPWTANAGIKTGPGAVNRLRVVADGPMLTGYINDTKVMEARDEVNEVGQLTLGLVTFDQGGLAVRFDNIEGEAEGMNLRENFSNAEVVPWSVGGSIIQDGEYEIFAQGGVQSWRQPLPPKSSEVQNFVLEVDTTLMQADEGAAYGVVFADGGSFDFYALYIIPDGSLMILRTDADGTVVPVLPPLPLDSLQTGANATNALRLEVRNSEEITISINGQELPGMRSSVPIEPGMVGMIVTSGQEGRVQVRFDNFRLEELVEGDDA